VSLGVQHRGDGRGVDAAGHGNRDGLVLHSGLRLDQYSVQHFMINGRDRSSDGGRVRADDCVDSKS
jgi:hypothetical protein